MLGPRINRLPAANPRWPRRSRRQSPSPTASRRGSGHSASPTLHFSTRHEVLRAGVMRLPVTLERDETGMIVAERPAIRDCVSPGTTEEEALANIREAIVGCLEVRAEQGLPLTVRTVEVDVAVA